MIYAAIIAGSLAVIALALVALRMSGWAHDLGKSEADRDRLEAQLRELVADDESDAAAAKARISQLLKEQEALRAEIRRRRHPGDARARLRRLSEAPGQEPDSDSPN